MAKKEIDRHNDAELFAMMGAGGRAGEAAFEELYNRFSPRVFKYCVRVLGNQELAEDTFQETFVKFYRSAGQDRVMTNVPAFILRIARNLCLNAKQSKYEGLTTIEDLTLSTPGHEYEKKELADMIASAIECLPIDYREAFVLREYDGLSYAEIAAVLEVSMATVKIRIYRAKQSIRKMLSPYLADLSL